MRTITSAVPKKIRRRSALFAFAIGLALLVSRPVAAEVTQIVVNSVNNTGPFRGKSYREVQLTMNGVAPGGDYSVPVVLAFPNVAADYNGFAVVDVLNTVTVGDPKWVLGGRIFPVARTNMGNEYLFGSGYVYVGPLWDKAAAEFFQTGTIAAPADGYESGATRRFWRGTRRIPFSDWLPASARRGQGHRVRLLADGLPLARVLLPNSTRNTGI